MKTVKYSLVELRNPLRPQAAKKFYARSQSAGEVSIDDMAEVISYASSMTDTDIIGVLRAVIRQMQQHLADGRIVNLGDFGSFQMILSSEGADTKEEFTQANIRKAKVQFRPGAMLNDMRKNLKYERVEPLPARKRASSEG